MTSVSGEIRSQRWGEIRNDLCTLFSNTCIFRVYWNHRKKIQGYEKVSEQITI